MSQTDRLSIVADAMQAKLQGEPTLNLKDVFWGDQELIPRFPAATVEPIQMERTMDGVPLMTVNNHSLYIYIYHCHVLLPQMTDRECIQHAEEIIAFLHKDTQMSDTVIQGWVKKYEPGQAVRNNNELLKATRITWEGLTKTGVGFDAG
jgi:hypothetical protein